MIDELRQRFSLSGMSPEAQGVHQGQPLLTSGPALGEAAAVGILLHGRGGTAWDMLQLAESFGPVPATFLAPRAAGRTWYPQRFLAPLEANEPALSSALAVVNELVDRAVAKGTPPERILLGGFSQGACLALEVAARRGGRLGGVFALSGALIGPPGRPRPSDRRLDGTPVFLGCGDDDPHIPLASVEETSRVLRDLGAVVSARIRPGGVHEVSEEDVARVRRMFDAVLAAA